MTKYLVSYKGVSIYFDDKRKCRTNKSCGRKEMIEMYLKGLVKLLSTVDLNDDWVIFGKHMEIVVDELMKRGRRGDEESA